MNVLNVNYDSHQTGANLQETRITPQIDWSTFGKVGTFPVDGQVYAQPLYVRASPSGRQLQRSLCRHHEQQRVCFQCRCAANHDAALAGEFRRCSSIRFVQLHRHPSGNWDIRYAGDRRNAKVMYVVSRHASGWRPRSPMFQLHALSLVDGHETLGGPVEIAASFSRDRRAEARTARSLSTPFQQLQRPGLILANGNVYVGFGSHGDTVIIMAGC